MKHRDTKLQELASRLVEREVYYCASSLIDGLKKMAGHLPANVMRDAGLDESVLQNLSEQMDYEEPAQEFILEGASYEDLESIANEFGDWGDMLMSLRPEFEAANAAFHYEVEDFDGDDWLKDFPEVKKAITNKILALVEEEDGWEKVCDDYQIDPEYLEVYEHWIVSDWLAGKLSAMGYVTGEVMGLAIYGRSCTGQSMSLDHNMQTIAADLWAEELAEAEKLDEAEQTEQQ